MLIKFIEKSCPHLLKSLSLKNSLISNKIIDFTVKKNDNSFYFSTCFIKDL